MFHASLRFSQSQRPSKLMISNLSSFNSPRAPLTKTIRQSYTPIASFARNEETDGAELPSYEASLIQSIAGLEDANSPTSLNTTIRARTLQVPQNPRHPLTTVGMAAQGADNVTATSTFRNLTIVDDYYLNVVDWAAGNFVIGHDQCVTVLSEDGLSKVAIRLLPSVPPPHHRRLEAVTAVAASKDGQYIAVATSLSTLCLLSVSTHTLLFRTQLNCGRIPSLSFRPCSKVLSVGTRRGVVFTFNVNRMIVLAARMTKRLVNASDLMTSDILLHEARAHDAEVCGVRWSEDGSYLATGGNDARVFVWRSPHVTPQAEPVKLVGHKAAVKAFAWSHASPHYLATGGGSSDGKLRIWDVRTGAMLAEVATRSQLCSIAWSERTNALCVGHGFSSNSVTRWEFDIFQGPSAIKQVGVVATHGGRVMFLGSDGKRVASGSSDGTIRVWSLFGAQKQPRMMTPDSLPLDLGAGLRKAPKKDLKSFFNVRTRGGLMLDPYTASMSVM
ncbi:WD domain G-beta repeat [Carpediemonas membranifera]|uniref:WD domain G-beta repeat n=1 Tax=Carpediemonas membranifera TaxID=201153 RepID=A0A8J6E3A5_9EUKA|nr:WD domain G-beta repeat [Carpediemonas membranifera]|eukprot:KAG9395366.1 WD domain G-beta repeat [Carpediemonas membranifera]